MEDPVANEPPLVLSWPVVHHQILAGGWEGTKEPEVSLWPFKAGAKEWPNQMVEYG